MRSRLSQLSCLIAVAASLSAGCATTPQSDSGKPSKIVQVYESDPYLGKGYDVVGRLWADSTRSRFRVPTYPSRDAAIAAMQAEAALLNADALISVGCLDQHVSARPQGGEPAFVCYGVAIQMQRRKE